MCECKNQRPTGKQTADKIWGNGRTSQATDSWPPRAKKPKPFTDSEMTALTRIIQDSVTELRRKQTARKVATKPAFTAKQREQIRQVVMDSIAENRRKPASEGYRITGADSGRYVERVTKLRTSDPAMNGKIVTIGNMRCQLVHGKMVCR